MNKAKGFFWLVVLGIFALLFFQNRDFFLERQTLRLNLFLGGEHQTPDLPLALFFVVFALSGFLIAYFFGLYARFKANQTIKGLNLKLNSHLETISNLNAETESLKSALERKNAETAHAVSEDEHAGRSSDEGQKLMDEV